MQLSTEDLKTAILTKAKTSSKSQLYIKDFYACDPETKPRVLKNAANDLVKEGKLMFWSSGSTTMYALKDRIKNEESTGGIWQLKKEPQALPIIALTMMVLFSFNYEERLVGNSADKKWDRKWEQNHGR